MSLLRTLRKRYYYGKRRRRVEHVMAIVRTVVVIGTLVINVIVLSRLGK